MEEEQRDGVPPNPQALEEKQRRWGFPSCPSPGMEEEQRRWGFPLYPLIPSHWRKSRGDGVFSCTPNPQAWRKSRGHRVSPVPPVPRHWSRGDGGFCSSFQAASAGRSLLLLRHVHGFPPSCKETCCPGRAFPASVLGGHPGLWSWIWLGVEVPALSALVGPVSCPALGSISGV